MRKNLFHTFLHTSSCLPTVSIALVGTFMLCAPQQGYSVRQGGATSSSQAAEDAKTKAEAELKTTKAELTRVQGELAKAKAELKTTKGELTRVQGELKTTKEELAKKEAELKTVQGELKKANESAHTAQSALSALQKKVDDIKNKIPKNIDGATGPQVKDALKNIDNILKQ